MELLGDGWWRSEEIDVALKGIASYKQVEISWGLSQCSVVYFLKCLGRQMLAVRYTLSYTLKIPIPMESQYIICYQTKQKLTQQYISVKAIK